MLSHSNVSRTVCDGRANIQENESKIYENPLSVCEETVRY